MFGSWIVGEAVKKVYIGGIPMAPSNTVQNGFQGCVKVRKL